MGIMAGLVWSRRTGWGCGGLITPGLLALQASDPARAAFTLLLGAMLIAPLSLVARAFRLWGRERVGAAMLLALAARVGLMFLIPAGMHPELHPLGWVIPGLIAADAERQGVGMTLCGTVVCSLTTAFCATLLRQMATGL
jgi:poly-gamma-glutamate biosynthesis protein PgsC/CapC